MSEGLAKLILISFVIGASLFIQGIRFFFRKRIIENTPTSKIRSIAMGFVELYGKVVPGVEILKSPFTNHDCVYYSYNIQERRSSGKSSYWKTIDSDKKTTNFFLKDNTGKVVIDSTGAHVDIPADFTSSSFKTAPLTLQTFVKQKNIKTSWLGIGRRMKFTEYYLAPNDKVYLLGTAASRPGSETAIKNEDKIIIKKGNLNKTFYISDTSEETLLKPLRWKVPLFVFGGVALIIIGLALLFFQIGIL